MPLSSYNGHSGPKREQVQRWLNEQWEAGHLPRPSRCIVCDQTEGAIHGHLENYDEPESYVDLCITCHLVLHARFRRREVWLRYLDLVASGWQAPPLQQRAGFNTLNRGILAGRFPQGVHRETVPGHTFLHLLEPQRSSELGNAAAP